MFDFDAITDAFLTIYGWADNPDPSGIQFVPPFEGSRLLNDVHPLLTPENLICTATDYTAIYPNDIAKQNAHFTEEIRRKTKGFIIQAIEQWEAEKLSDTKASNLLGSGNYFGGGNASDLIGNSDRSVGLEIIPRKKSQNLKNEILQVSFAFDRAVEFNLYVFELGKGSPIKTIPIKYTLVNSEQWFDVQDLKLNGELPYWFVYEQHAAQAINTQSAGINGSDYFSVTPFSTDQDIIQIWDLKKNRYNYHLNYGINFKYSAKCEFTGLITDNLPTFYNMIALRVAIGFLRLFAHNPNTRANRNERQFNNQQILFEIEGNPQGRKTGLNYRYEKALKNATITTKGVDPICLPCAKRKGVKYSNVAGIKFNRKTPLFSNGFNNGSDPNLEPNMSRISIDGTGIAQITTDKLVTTVVVVPNGNGVIKISRLAVGGGEISEETVAGGQIHTIHIGEYFKTAGQLYVTGDATFKIYIE